MLLLKLIETVTVPTSKVAIVDNFSGYCVFLGEAADIPYKLLTKICYTIQFQNGEYLVKYNNNLHPYDIKFIVEG